MYVVSRKFKFINIFCKSNELLQNIAKLVLKLFFRKLSKLTTYRYTKFTVMNNKGDMDGS